jgi:isoleucyl-tRNA synthetase
MNRIECSSSGENVGGTAGMNLVPDWTRFFNLCKMSGEEMAFRDVPTKVDFPAQERELLQFWKESRAFRKVEAVCPKRNLPGLLSMVPSQPTTRWVSTMAGGRTYKDAMLRFKTMLGHELRYQNGFDCQGLWVEVEVEKEFGFKSKKDIEEFGSRTVCANV